MPFRTVVVFGIVGVVLGVVAFIRLRDRVQRRAIADLFLATLCAAPLILLVIAVGEPPRNYLAQIAILVAIASVGAIWAVERLVVVRPPLLLVPIGGLIGLAVGLVAANMVAPSWTTRAAIGGAVLGAAVASLPWLVRRTGRSERIRLPELAVGALLVVALVVATATLTVHVRRTQPDPLGRGIAVTTVTRWLQDNIPPGAKVAFPSFLGYEMALGLHGRAEAVQVRARIAIADPTAPEGLIRVGEDPAGDWIAVDTAPRNVNEYQAYRAAWLERQLGAGGVQYWVYTTGLSTAAGTIIPALASSTGIEQVAHWTFPVPGHEPLDRLRLQDRSLPGLLRYPSAVHGAGRARPPGHLPRASAGAAGRDRPDPAGAGRPDRDRSVGRGGAGPAPGPGRTLIQATAGPRRRL